MFELVQIFETLYKGSNTILQKEKKICVRYNKNNFYNRSIKLSI